MRTTVIFNAKGGVGKTMTVINMAAELASRGQRVVVIDADPQCNLTWFYGADAAEGQTLYELLTAQNEPYYGDWITQGVAPGISLVPASMDLILADVHALRDGTVRLTAIRELCEVMAEDDYCDYVLIDCPPSFTAATTAALAAADDVIIPIKLDAFSVGGMGELMRQIKGMREINPRIRLAGALITMTQRRAVVTRAAEADLRASAIPVFGATIRATAAVDRSTYARLPLRAIEGTYAKLAAEDYAAVVDEYLEGGSKHVTV